MTPFRHDGGRDEVLVSHESLRRYLLSHGWRSSLSGINTAPMPDESYEAAIFRARQPETRSAEIFVLSEEGFEDIEVAVPRGTSLQDFARRLEGIVTTLSQVEGRNPNDVILDVRSIGFDVIRSRIPNEMVYEDTIHLAKATAYLIGIKGLLASTATTELSPDPYFLRLKKEASTFADQCRFGHTFKGSFGFTIESPVIANTAPMLPILEQRPPFERRVIQRLATGIMAVCHAVDTHDTAPLVAMDSTGFSANMYEQFADVIEETSLGGMALGFSFSPEWAPPEAFRQVREFLVGVPHVEVSREAAKVLRNRPLPHPERVFGRVIRLQNQSDPTELFAETSDGEVVIQWASEELGDTHVRVRLKPNDYLAALEAHGNGKPVTVSGTLQQQGRRWLLTSPANFSVAP